MAANNRIFYACQQVGLKPDGDRTNAFAALHGVQSVGITTNFNLEQVFQLGQLAVYEDVEEVPDIEVSVERVLDGVTFHDKVRESDTPNSADGPPPNINQMHCHLQIVQVIMD